LPFIKPLLNSRFQAQNSKQIPILIIQNSKRDNYEKYKKLQRVVWEKEPVFSMNSAAEMEKQGKLKCPKTAKVRRVPLWGTIPPTFICGTCATPFRSPSNL